MPRREDLCLRLDVPASDGERGLCALPVFEFVGGVEFALLAGQERDVVVLPDEGHEVVAVASAHEVQANEEGERVRSVDETDVRELFCAAPLCMCGYIQMCGREISERGEIGIRRERRVVPS